MLIYRGNSTSFESFVVATDSKALTWELRGHGETPAEAAENGWNKFNSNETTWKNFGRVT